MIGHEEFRPLNMEVRQQQPRKEEEKEKSKGNILKIRPFNIFTATPTNEALGEQMYRCPAPHQSLQSSLTSCRRRFGMSA